MPAQPNPFSILNVSPEADPVVIEAAHKALMKKYHPDRLGAGSGDAKRAAMINEAFSILKDPRKRAEYHLRLMPPERIIMMPPSPAARSLRMAAWSGWLTAIAVAVALAVTIHARDNRFPPIPANGPALASSEAAGETRDAGAAVVPVAAAAAVAAPVMSRAATAAIIEPQEAKPAPKRRVAKYRKQRKAVRKRAPAPARAPADGEFLERQGYIY